MATMIIRKATKAGGVATNTGGGPDKSAPPGTNTAMNTRAIAGVIMLAISVYMRRLWISGLWMLAIAVANRPIIIGRARKATAAKRRLAGPIPCAVSNLMMVIFVATIEHTNAVNNAIPNNPQAR